MSDVARALVLTEPRHLELREVPLPDVGDDDGLLRVEACGLCGTDHEQYTGALPAGFAFVPGHEAVGVIEAIGARAAERWGVTVGDRVAVEVFQSCRACPACAAGEYRRCERHGIGDMYGFVPVDTAPTLWGGYATHQYLSPDTMLHRVPESLTPEVATLFNPLGAGVRWGATVPGTSAGDVVAVLGPGVRGLSAVAAAKRAGAGFVMVTGVGPGDDERLAIAERFGADLSVDVGATDPVPRAEGRDRWAGRHRRRRDRQGTEGARAGDRAGTTSAARSSWPAPAARARRRGSGPTSSSSRSCASRARSVSTRLRTARRWRCSPTDRCRSPTCRAGARASTRSRTSSSRWPARAIRHPSTASLCRDSWVSRGGRI